MIHLRRKLLFWLVLSLGLVLAGASGTHAQSKGKPGPAKASPSPAGKASPSPSPGTELPDPVATVDGEPVSREDLTKIAASLLGASGRNLDELTPAEKRGMYRSVLDEIISDRLISKASAGEQVDDMDLEKQYSQIRQQYPDEQSFEDALKKAGQTKESVKANIRKQLEQTVWIEKHIADDVKVDPLEVEKFYKESPSSRFDAPEMVRASHILVAVRRDATPEAAVKAEDKIKMITDKLAQGESFGSLAKQYSDDPATAEQEGDLDYFSRERIMPEFADAAFKLKIGEVSQPVRTQFGLHLIKLTDRKPAHTATLDEAREQIIDYLQKQKRKQAVDRLTDSLKAQAKIDNRLASS